MAVRVSAVLLLGLLCCSCCLWFAEAEIPQSCCLKVSEKRLPSRLIVDYYIQKAAGGGGGCRIDATVFITRADRKMCFPLPGKSAWVQGVIDNLQRGQSERVAEENRPHV